ncbi:Nn.00g099880.m01.CDS01 [Neocucurbitaria sp. VM-36]
MTSQDFNIAIVGAGIGGLGFAIGLNHLNVPFTIYESAPQFSAVGAGLGLGPNALHAMDMIDKRFSEMYMAIATGNLKPEKKHVMMEAMRMEEGLGKGESWWGHGGWGAEYYERTGAHRKDLLDIMTSLIKKEAVRFNKRVQTMRQAEGSVTLTFEDGDVAHHAAVIGCDGVKGFSRRVVLGDRYPECVEPQYTDKYAYRTIVPMSDAKEILGDLATDAKMYMSKGVSLSTYPISRGKAVNVVAFKRDTQPWRHPESTYDVTREEMLNDFLPNNPDSRLVKLLEWAKPTRWAITHHLNTPTYYNSLVCMLGDVAHAGGPYQGAGAGQCLEDSLILSRVLGKLHHCTPNSILSSPSPLRTKIIEAAFQAYDEVRRPRAQEQVRTSQECGEIYTLMDPVHGDDIPKVVAKLNGRFEWIWLHDLAADVRQVQARYEELAGLKSQNRTENARL